MKIILITSKLSFEDNGAPIGGSVVDLHLKAKGLVELGHEVSVVTAFSNADRITGELPYRVFQRCIKRRGLISLQKGVYSFLKEFESKADVFYIDGHMFLYGGGAYRMFGGKKPVVGFFNVRLNAWADASGNVARPSFFLLFKKKLRLLGERILGAPIANHLDAFIFNTPHVQKMYHSFGIARKKPNAVIEDFIATRELMRRFNITSEGVRTHQEAGGPILFLSTGRMLPEKGFALLVRAFARVMKNPSSEDGVLPFKKGEYRLVLSGGGPEKERLEKLAGEFGLGENIIFPGWVEKEKLYQFFKEAHVFIFPRWWLEYGSAVLTEAMAFGLPSIIPGGGALEWLTNGAALPFFNDSVEELAKRIEELGANQTLRTELAEKALTRAEALDARVLAKRLEQIIKSVV
ncbi:MAG: glycosyltransferase family 4 protein [bacterium]|nr:glycosyltransferase family 4 protein [bacterium]